MLHQSRTGTNAVRSCPKSRRRFELLELRFAQHACLKPFLCGITQSSNACEVLVLVFPKGAKVGARDLATTLSAVG